MNLTSFLKEYYFIKNIYTLNSFIKVKKINYYINNLTNFDMNILINNLNNDYNYLGESRENNTENSETFNIIVDYLFILSGYDEYHIDINYKKEITIKYSTKRSLLYVIEILNNIFNSEEGLLPIVHIDDYSDFNIRGIIEGYYGKPYTHENHLDMIEFMNKKRLNCYMYAPKKDDYHRKKWDLLYPSSLINEFKELLDKASLFDIDVYYTISPGFHEPNEPGFDYTNKQEFKRLFNKIDQLIECGFKHFGLLLDDIDYNLSDKEKEIFKTPGNAHSYICNELYLYIINKLPNASFVMCPTEYHELNDSIYRKDLREKLNKNIQVFYTGDNVCAEILTDVCINEVKKQFDHDLLIWENYPVTDFTYGVRQYIGPIRNRSVNLGKLTNGYLINPMEYYEISKIGMATCSDYAWNPSKYDENVSFVNALKAIGDDFYNIGQVYFDFNLPSVITYGNLNMEKELLNNFVINNDYDSISLYYQRTVASANGLLLLDYPIIKELTPWLEHVKKEEELSKKILNNQVTKEQILEFLQDTHFNGSELIDWLIKYTNLLTEEEYQSLITKKRGNPWYRVWEHKRYNTKIS